MESLVERFSIERVYKNRGFVIVYLLDSIIDLSYAEKRKRSRIIHRSTRQFRANLSLSLSLPSNETSSQSRYQCIYIYIYIYILVPPSNDEWTVVMTNYCTRYVMHQAASIEAGREYNEEASERASDSVLNFIPTPTKANRPTFHQPHPVIIVHVRRIWSLNERGPDDSNLLSMAANLRPTDHLPASGTRIPLNHVSCIYIYIHICSRR